MSRTNTIIIGTLLLLVGAVPLPAQQIVGDAREGLNDSKGTTATRSDDAPREVLSTEEWRRVDNSVDRGLTYLAAQQQADGSFPTDSVAQPGVTSLCVLAFMAHGHNPGSGPYGERLDRAVRYIADCQKPSGLIMLLGSDEPQIDRDVAHDIGSSGTYDHAISS